MAGPEVVVAEVVVVGSGVVVSTGSSELPDGDRSGDAEHARELSVTVEQKSSPGRQGHVHGRHPVGEGHVLPVVQSPWAGNCGAVPSGRR